MSSRESTISTHIFDHQLLREGDWDDETESRLLEWIKTPDYLKSEVAAKILGHLIRYFLKDDISERGILKANNIEENLMHLENILSTTKGGIIKKFYRDHLNHSIRVLLLASCLAESILDLEMTEDEKKRLKIAAIFHDFSYPLSEVYEIYNAIIKAMREIYDSVTFPDFICSDNPELLCNLLSNIDIPAGFTIKNIGEELTKRNHSVLSSLEFLTYLKPESWEIYANVLKAILIHDPSFNVKLDLYNDKISSILILADELQDWGRISSYEKTLTIEEISSFSTKDSKIQGEINWNDTSSLSPLRQIYSKQKSLSRIFIDDMKNFEMEIIYALPEYEIIEYTLFESILSRILSLYENPEMLYENFENVDVFEKKYLGVVGKKYAYVLDYLLTYNIDNSFFKGYNLHISENRSESWLLKKELSNPTHMSINFNNLLTLNLRNKEIIKEGVLKNQNDTELLEMYKIISKQISILYQISSDHIETPPYRLPPKNSNDFAYKMTKFMLSGDEINQLSLINTLPKILRLQGLFAFF